MSCLAPLSNEQLVAYWANDLDAHELDAVEQHLFSCDSCLAAAERVASIAQAFRTSMPPVISHAELTALRAQGLSLGENMFEAGKRQSVSFEAGMDLLIHHLSGLDLATAERVEVRVRTESTGAVIFEDMFAPFDRERGEVLIACQKHFAVFPR
ncbi:MAG TPA: zf-HC2 domain-containing protein, partial [Kofleriaceae bacterium]